MTNRLEIYKCEICGNMVEMIHDGAGQLVCCGQAMKRFDANTVDAAKEKHVPVVEMLQDKMFVKVGSVPHPMEDKHYIEWIEVISGNKTIRHFLRPNDKPEATFCKPDGDFTVREYCNLHGLWKGESK